MSAPVRFEIKMLAFMLAEDTRFTLASNDRVKVFALLATGILCTIVFRLNWGTIMRKGSVPLMTPRSDWWAASSGRATMTAVPVAEMTISCAACSAPGLVKLEENTCVTPARMLVVPQTAHTRVHMALFCCNELPLVHKLASPTRASRARFRLPLDPSPSNPVIVILDASADDRSTLVWSVTNSEFGRDASGVI